METSVTEKSGNVLGDNLNYPEKIRQHAVFNRREVWREEPGPGASAPAYALPERSLPPESLSISLSLSLSLSLVSFELRAV